MSVELHLPDLPEVPLVRIFSSREMERGFSVGKAGWDWSANHVSAADLARRLAKREVSCREVTEEFLGRIESLEQVQYMREIGCEFAQGFFYSRSLSADTILDYLERAGAA